MTKWLIFIFLFMNTLLANESDNLKKKAALFAGYLQYTQSQIEDPFHLDIDFEDFIEGLKEAHAGKTPEMSLEAYIEYINSREKEAFEKASTENLKEAEETLKNLNLIHIIDNKIHYELLNSGEGEPLSETGTGIFALKAQFLNTNPFYEGISKQRLESAIEGFSIGAAGMLPGEKRRLFIHPDFSYGTQQIRHPNKLLIVEVELKEVTSISSVSY